MMYRCQSAVKLVELNDRYRIFSRFQPSTVVDLAAAPGGFAQVALELMHVPEIAAGSSMPPMVIAVDQRPIAPIPGLVAVRGNILQHQRILSTVHGIISHGDVPETSLPCLSSSAHTPQLARTVDMVLHDGVSVVKGQRTSSITYAQNQMALSALLLAGKLFQRFGPMLDLSPEAEQHRLGKRHTCIGVGNSAPLASSALLPVCFVSKVLHCRHFAQVLAAARTMFRHVRTCKPLATRPDSLERYVVATHFDIEIWRRLTAPHPPEQQKRMNQRRRKGHRSALSTSLFSMPPASEDCGSAHNIVWNCLGCGRTCLGCQPCEQCGPFCPVEDTGGEYIIS